MIMKPKNCAIIFTVAILSCLAIYVVHHIYQLAYKPVASLSIQQLQEAIQKAGDEDVLEKQANEAIRRYSNGAISIEITNCPAITRMASIVGGQIVQVVPDGVDGIGVPAHVLIRRGSHFDYQFIYIFGTGVVPSTNNLDIELIGGSIYLRNTGVKK